MAIINNTMLKGNIAQPPFFDRVGKEQFPFLRFYLAVDSGDLALVLLKGNVVQPPFFNRFGDAQRAFLKLHLAVDRPKWVTGQSTDFLRVVAYDDLALFSYPYLQPGSEVLVDGNLRARKRRMKGGKEETVVEVVVGDEIDFLSKIKWETGNAARKRILAEREKDTSGPLRQPYGGFIRVVAFHDLALFTYPYLRVGSLLFVRGRLQARKRQLANGKRKTVVEVVARDITFLRDTDKERGNAARDRILEARKRGADV